MSTRDQSSAIDVRAVAEALADVLAERGLMAPAAVSLPAVMDAAEVAVLLGRDRKWVYDHAGELGAFRFGDGPRARIGFDLTTVERWKHQRQISQTKPGTRKTPRPPRRREAAAPNLIPYESSGSGP